MAEGRFITLEGAEGVGKSTCMGHVAARLRSAGIDFVQTREPGGTPLGDALRSLVLHPDHRGMAPETELLMIFAARKEHIERVIVPALEQGRWVLSDRFTEASYAYQGGGRGIASAHIEWLEGWVQAGLAPDLTLLLDAPVEISLARARARAEIEPDRFHREETAFFQRVREAYLARSQRDPERIRVIDAAPPLDQVLTQIDAVLDVWLPAPRGR